MRRLPIYFLIDVSESMVGDPIDQVQDGMATIIQELRTDPYALETACISIIAFAGKAKKLTPLTELYNFYPPKLPIGGGTSLGGALDFLMREIDSAVVKTTAEVKGDWKPIVFLFTDGNPTDEYKNAFERWNKHFRGKVNLVIISIGYNADTKILGQITENVLVLRNTDAASFKQFFKWVTASIKTSSASIGEGRKDDLYLAPIVDDLLAKIDTGKNLPEKVDDNFAVFLARCQQSKRQYLIKYALQLNDSYFIPGMNNMLSYRLAGAYPVDSSYDELSDPRAMTSKVNTAFLHGFPTCPCCGNQFGFSTCACGAIHCADEKPTQTCPWCGQTAQYSIGESHQDVTRTRG